MQEIGMMRTNTPRSGHYDQEIQPKLRGLLHRPATAWTILITSLLFTFIGWQVANKFIYRDARARFTFKTHDIEHAIQQRMLQYEQVLRSGIGLFTAFPHADRQAWQEYVARLQISQHFPGIQGIGFSLRLTSTEKEAHIQQIRAEGFPQYTIRPETPRAEYHTIVYLEPFDQRNQRAFGYDMYSNPVRRAAMDRAMETGQMAISGLVTLVQEMDTDVQPGFLMYLPLYRPGAPLTTVVERAPGAGRICLQSVSYQRSDARHSRSWPRRCRCGDL